MADSEAELTVEEKQYPLDPSLLDVEVYRSPDRYQQELNQVLLRGWFPVAPSTDVPNPRDYLVWEQLEQSVLISRLDDGTIPAWHSSAEHASSTDPATAVGGNFICPWHGFAYNLDLTPRSLEMLGAKPMKWKLT